eukprot:scaffold5748_cov124-Isochrysis_galbana.AAC.6
MRYVRPARRLTTKLAYRSTSRIFFMLCLHMRPYGRMRETWPTTTTKSASAAVLGAQAMVPAARNR